AGVSFWCSIQERNGSFNEWYPHEGSYVATAFSAYAISETLLLMGADRIADYDRAVAALSRAAGWIKDRTEQRVCNQQTGALLATYNTYLLTGDDRLMAAVNGYEDALARAQKREEWFLEYSGADIGYLSLSIDYLAKYFKKTGSRKTEEIVAHAINFIVNFIHADGSSGGVYGSRHTEYLIPDGFEIFAPISEQARFAAWNIRAGLERGRGISLHQLDDRYLTYISYTFLQAALDGMDEIDETPIARADYRYYPEAGLFVRRFGDLELIANVHMTGALVCIARGKRLADSGVVIDGARQLFSGYETGATTVSVDENGFSVEGPFRETRENILSPIKQIILYLFQLTAGRVSFANHLVKERLRRRMILSHRRAPATLKRTVAIDGGGILITDEIAGTGRFKRMITGTQISFIYVPSSRWFQRENLTDEPPVLVQPVDVPPGDGNILIERHFPSGKITITRRPAH
ncbi:MAG TPA: hypothetical protein P5287_03505, partial [bacterium]|nr:hypothetical protein [bacterium]